MSDMGEMWQEERQAYKERRDKRLDDSYAQLESLKKYLNGVPNFSVIELTPYHFRITKPGSGKCLDVYPVHRKYHDITTNKRGGYKNLAQFVNTFFEKKP